MIEKIKDIIYQTALFGLKLYWRIFKPKTFGARILLVSKNKILLVQPRKSNYWNLPGGGIHGQEDPSLASLRELYEETNIKIENTDYQLGTYTSNKEGKQDTIYIFVKEITEEVIPRIVLELQNAQWFPIYELPEGTTKPTLYRIEEYKKGLCNTTGIWAEKNF